LFFGPATACVSANVGVCQQGTYMQLPTDQYVLIPLPNNAKLEKQSEDLFTLLVPELQLFNVWLRPHVVSKVEVTPDGVLIEAVECRLDGSPEVQRLDLNSKFELSVKVVLQGIQGLFFCLCASVYAFPCLSLGLQYRPGVWFWLHLLSRV